MADDNFADYQALRSNIEKDVRATIGGWALGDAPNEMTVDQVRQLTSSVVALMNAATRQCWNLGMRHADLQNETQSS